MKHCMMSSSQRTHLLYVAHGPDTELCGLLKVVHQHGHESHDVERQPGVAGGVKDGRGGVESDAGEQLAGGVRGRLQRQPLQQQPLHSGELLPLQLAQQRLQVLGGVGGGQLQLVQGLRGRGG